MVGKMVPHPNPIAWPWRLHIVLCIGAL